MEIGALDRGLPVVPERAPVVRKSAVKKAQVTIPAGGVARVQLMDLASEEGVLGDKREGLVGLLRDIGSLLRLPYGATTQPCAADVCSTQRAQRLPLPCHCPGVTTC